MAEDKENSKEKESIFSREDRNMREWALFTKVGITIFVTFTACIAVFFLFYRYKGVSDVWNKALGSLSPIIVGAVLAYLMNPVMKFIQDFAYKRIEPKAKNKSKAKKTARTIGIFGSVVLLILVIALLIASIVPAIISSVTSLVQSMPGYVDKFTETIEKGNFGNNEYVVKAMNWLNTATDELQDWAKTKLMPQMTTYIQQITVGIYGVLKGVLNFIIGIIVMIYVMTIQETLIGQTKKIIYAIFKPKRANVITKTFRKADKIFGGFITGKLLDSLIIGIICYVGCLILRIPDSVLIAVIVGVTNIIPVFGPFIGAVPSLFLVVIQSPIHALYLLIFIIVLQQVDGNIIGPKILGSSTGLSTFWVMFAILIGGGMFGFMGMLLGVPTFGVIYYIIKKFINYLLRGKGLSENTKDYYSMKSVDKATNELVYTLDKDEQLEHDKDLAKKQNTKDKEIIEKIKNEKERIHGNKNK